MNDNLPRDFTVRCARAYPAKTAYVDGDRSLTWGELHERSDRLAGALQALGVRKGDVVALLAHDHMELVEHWHACLKLGALRTAINYRYAPREIAHILSDSNARVLLVEDDLIPVLERCLEELDGPPPVLVGIGSSDGLELDYERLLAAADEPRLPYLGETDHAAISYTSGTTGMPKGALFTQRSLREALTWMPLNVGLRHEDVWANALPAPGAPMVFTAANASNGMTCVLPDGRFRPRRFLELVSEQRITSTIVVPTMLAQLLQELETGDYDTSSLRLVCYGSMPSTPALITAAREAFGCELQQWYGATETTAGPTVILRDSDHQRGLAGEPELLTSCGVPQPQIELDVRSEDGTSLPAGQVGEVWMRGPTIFDGYLNRPRETAEVMVGEWLRPGDLGRLDAEGRLYLVDRKKFMIISGGYNVFPVVVENVLAEHPAIHEAAVVGAPHPHWGEAVVAVVALRPGAAAGPEEIVEYCAERVGKWEVPKHVLIVDELPKGATAKIQKHEIREWFRSDPARLPWHEVPTA
jgi:acyl-CoA synthetase (AMP-forming)/AMP-acid ligase II